MYRPKNWITIVNHLVSTEIYYPREVELGRKFVDAGADAMLQGIKDLLQEEANECAGSPYGSACLMLLEEKLQ